MLDDDVLGLISDVRQREGKSIKHVVNEALRRGLAEGASGRAAYRSDLTTRLCAPTST